DDMRLKSIFVFMIDTNTSAETNIHYSIINEHPILAEFFDRMIKVLCFNSSKTMKLKVHNLDSRSYL
ncbi:MAG: hypothetical protein AAFX57_16610, partial [Bacteroidota bacterium]